MNSEAPTGSMLASGCMRPAGKVGAKDACWVASGGGPASIIGRLFPAADVEIRKNAGFSVAIGGSGWVLVELTCQSTGALAGCAESDSAGTRTRPADARTGWDATKAGGAAGCWCGDADMAFGCCCW